MPIHVIGQSNQKYIVVLSDEKNAEKVMRMSMFLELGTMWTINNTPYYVKATYPEKDEWEFEEMVLRTMLKYGVHNVRGGSYRNEVLSEDDTTIAERNVKAIKTRYTLPIQKVFRGHMVRKKLQMV